MEITGTIIEIFAEQVVSDKFKKREFVLKVVDNGYEQEIKFQTTQDKTTILNFVKLNDEVKVLFNLGGRRWTKEGKTNWFNSVTAWTIEKVGSDQVVTSTPETNVDPTNDLPF
jgi:spore germination protein YaaH